MLLKLAWGNVRKSLGDFGIYFLTVALGVGVFYAFNAITDQDAVVALGASASSLIELLRELIGGVSVFVAAVLAFLVVYANRFLVRRRAREFGLYLVLGMRTPQVVGVVALETVIAGVASLAGGLALGWVAQQGLMHATASLFGGSVPGFVVGYSTKALLATLIAFGAIFLLATLMNARTVMRSKLVDLLQAQRRNEAITLRSIPLSVVLFAVSCAIIAVSYRLLHENGLMEPSLEFLAATILVCVGTGLFFYSLSGFLLALGHLLRPLYLRGLNAFTLRQLGSKVNSTSASATVICLALFLAITSACGGFGIVNALRASLERTTAYDATAASLWTDYVVESGQEERGSFFHDTTYAAAHSFDMTEGLRDSAARLGYDFDALVARSVQIDSYIDVEHPLTFARLDELSDKPLSSYLRDSLLVNAEAQTLNLVPLSQANAALALAGKPELKANANECILVADFEYVVDYYRDLAKKHPQVSVGGRALTITGFADVSLETTAVPLNAGLLVVPDSAIPEGAVRGRTALNLQAAPGISPDELQRMVRAVAENGDGTTWPLNCITRQEVYEQSLGFSGVVAFLAIYIGLVLTVACAAVLAIQQLTEANDSSRRYRLLRRLGTPERMIGESQLSQVAACFLFPLALALAHTACALQVVTDVVAIFGHMEIGTVALSTLAVFLGVYGVYPVTTFAAGRRITR